MVFHLIKKSGTPRGVLFFWTGFFSSATFLPSVLCPQAQLGPNQATPTQPNSLPWVNNQIVTSRPRSAAACKSVCHVPPGVRFRRQNNVTPTHRGWFVVNCFDLGAFCMLRIEVACKRMSPQRSRRESNPGRYFTRGFLFWGPRQVTSSVYSPGLPAPPPPHTSMSPFRSSSAPSCDFFRSLNARLAIGMGFGWNRAVVWEMKTPRLYMVIKVIPSGTHPLRVVDILPQFCAQRRWVTFGCVLL